jgi:hypothetical protein
VVVERVLPMAAVATRISTWGTVYHYFRLWRNTTVWVHLYRGEREKPVIRLSSACSQAKLGLDLQAWINRTRWWSA